MEYLIKLLSLFRNPVIILLWSGQLNFWEYNPLCYLCGNEIDMSMTLGLLIYLQNN